MRRVETLDKDRKTVNVFEIPSSVTLDMAIKRQDDIHFRDLYFMESHPTPYLKGTVK